MSDGLTSRPNEDETKYDPKQQKALLDVPEIMIEEEDEEYPKKECFQWERSACFT